MKLEHIFKKHLFPTILIVGVIAFLALYFTDKLPAQVSSGPFDPGQYIDPPCGPTDLNCTVRIFPDAPTDTKFLKYDKPTGTMVWDEPTGGGTYIRTSSVDATVGGVASGTNPFSLATNISDVFDAIFSAAPPPYAGPTITALTPANETYEYGYDPGALRVAFSIKANTSATNRFTFTATGGTMSSPTWNGTPISLFSGSEFTLAGTGTDFDTPIPADSTRSGSTQLTVPATIYGDTSTLTPPTSSSVIFSINAKDTTDVASGATTRTITWKHKKYYGMSSTATAISDSEILDLAGGGTATSRVTPDTNFTPSGSQYVYFVWPASFESGESCKAVDITSGLSVGTLNCFYVNAGTVLVTDFKVEERILVNDEEYPATYKIYRSKNSFASDQAYQIK